MDWNALAAVGEIVGATAVLATLGFLAIQVRHGKRLLEESNVLARSAASDKAFEQFTSFRRLLAADSDATRLWLAGCANQTLDAVDEERFHQLATDYLYAYALYIQRMEALDLPQVAENGVRVFLAQIEQRPGLRRHWPEVAESIASSALAAKISSGLSG